MPLLFALPALVGKLWVVGNMGSFVLDRKSQFMPMNPRDITLAIKNERITSPEQIMKVLPTGLVSIDAQTFAAFKRGSPDLVNYNFVVEKGPFAGTPISIRTENLNFNTLPC